MQVAGSLGPAAQQMATRGLIAAINGDDMALALEMVPESPPSSEQDQVRAAMGQNAVAITNGQPPMGRETDMVQIHVPIHLGALARMLQNAAGQGEQWTPKDQQAFEALAAHAMTDIRRLGMQDERAGRHWQQQLIQMVGKASAFQIGTDVRPNLDPLEAAKMGQAQAKFEQAERFKQLDMAKWERTQHHREESSRFNEDLQMGYLTEAEKSNQVKRATSLVKAVKDAQTPVPAPAGSSAE